MGLRKRQETPETATAPEPSCDCGERLAALESLVSALARGLIVRSPSHSGIGAAQNLAAWGLQPADATAIARAARKEPA
jgi:hypothetical protein